MHIYTLFIVAYKMSFKFIILLSSFFFYVRRHQDLSYKVTPGDEVEDMFILLNEVKRQIPSVAAVSSGAIASDYQRLRVESVCARLGLVSLAYLWKQDQTFLLEEMVIHLVFFCNITILLACECVTNS